MFAREDARRLAGDRVLGQQAAFGGEGLQRLGLLRKRVGAQRAAAAATNGEEEQDCAERQDTEGGLASVS